MKVASLIAVLAFSAAQAAAIVEQEPEAFRAIFSSCGAPGQPCDKAKRAANAVADALAEAAPQPFRLWSSCGMPGMPCAKARRSLDNIEDSVDKAISGLQARNPGPGHRGEWGRPSKRDASPEPFRLWSSCGMPGMPCAKAKRGLELIKEDFPNLHQDECFAEGGECHAVLKARAAFDDAVKREAEPWRLWSSCGMPGMPCARDVVAFEQAKANGDPAAKKAEEECNAPNGDCTAAKEFYNALNAALSQAVEDVYNNA